MKGTVWRAMQQPTGRPVAIKFLPATSAEEAQRFERGARIASNLNHPHITTVHDYGTTPDGAFYLVMELLEGQTLQHMLKHSVPSILDTLVIVDQILRALEAAHAANVVHRDLKPANLFLTRKNDDIYFTKILDFGLAKFATAHEEESHDSDGVQRRRPTVEIPVEVNNDVTQAQRICGTPEYMAPEQILGAPLDRRTDLYALGVILYRMLSGNLPFRANQRHELYQQHLSAAPPPFVVTQNVPESISRVVMKALAKRPADRFADASEMRLALREANRTIAAELGHSFTGLFHSDARTGASSTGSMVIQKRSKLPWIIAGAALLLAGGLTGVILGNSGDAATQPAPTQVVEQVAQKPEPKAPEIVPEKPVPAAAAPSAPTMQVPVAVEAVEAQREAEPPAVEKVAKTGTLALTTTPEGVEVWHQGRLLGTTPARMPLPEGTQDLDLRGKGIKPTTVPVAIVAERETPITLQLELAQRSVGSRRSIASPASDVSEAKSASPTPSASVLGRDVAGPGKPSVGVLGKDITQENPTVKILGSDLESEKPKVKLLGQ